MGLYMSMYRRFVVENLTKTTTNNYIGICGREKGESHLIYTNTLYIWG